MAFRIICGTFHVVGYSPDGDSIRFKASDPSNWELLDGPPPKINAKGHVQLRLEAIDTLETHYLGTHQPLEMARAALNHLSNQLGIEDIVWNQARTKVKSAADGTSGYIVTREVERNRRPVSFAFAGQPMAADGSTVFLDRELVSLSVNAEMLRSGLAYPTYYKGLFSDLREVLSLEVKNARDNNAGIWAQDVTNTGFTVNSLTSIAEENVIMPKLFRRLATYVEGGGSGSGFKAYLEQLAEEVMVISTVHATHFDTLIEENADTIRLTEPPENLIFIG